jgi:hypothetical protein
MRKHVFHLQVTVAKLLRLRRNQMCKHGFHLPVTAIHSSTFCSAPWLSNQQALDMAVQANKALVHAAHTKDRVGVEALWQNKFLTDEDRAEAVRHTITFDTWIGDGEDSIAAWMLAQPNLSIPALSSVMVHYAFPYGWSNFLWLIRHEPKRSAFEATLRVGIHRCIHFSNMPLLWMVIARVGGQAAVLDAIDHGYRRRFHYIMAIIMSYIPQVSCSRCSRPPDQQSSLGLFVR